MFISSLNEGRHKWYHYLATIAIVLVVMQMVGVIPLLVTVMLQVDAESFTPEVFESVASSLSGDLMVLFTGISFIATIGAFILCMRFIHLQPAISSVTTRLKIDFKRVAIGFLLVVVFRIPVLIAQTTIYDDSLTWNFEMPQFFWLLIVCISVIPFQSAFEEVLFRGYLLRRLTNTFNSKYISICATTLLFTVVHFANPEAVSFGWPMFAFYVITALFLASIVLYDNGTELAIGIHSGINIFTLLTVTGDWSSFQTSALFINTSRDAFLMDIALLSLVVYPIVFILLAKRYGWVLVPQEKD